ncbi:MAG: hypothetical protein K6U80_19575 [Firmicutes bacterium]|nr:hypothetical protein [Bacillota bacterium]
MDTLGLIFDQETLLQGDEVAQQLKKYYDKVEHVVGLNASKRPRMNRVFYFFPYFFKHSCNKLNDV